MDRNCGASLPNPRHVDRIQRHVEQILPEDHLSGKHFADLVHDALPNAGLVHLLGQMDQDERADAGIGRSAGGVEVPRAGRLVARVIGFAVDEMAHVQQHVRVVCQARQRLGGRGVAAEYDGLAFGLESVRQARELRLDMDDLGRGDLPV